MQKFVVFVILFHGFKLFSVRSEIIIRDGNGDIPLYIRIKSMEASFGHSLPFRGLIGFVKSSEPLDGCSHVQKAPDRYPRDPHWFIILKRSSNCTFIDKVEAATIGNYSAAIVFNDRSDRVFHMGGNSPNLIPSVFIGATDGEKILKNYLFPKNIHSFIAIYPEESFQVWMYLYPLVIFIAILLTVISIKYIQYHLQNRRNCLSKSALKNLPIIKYNRGNSPYDTCCICLDDFINNDTLRILPCDHGYHKCCIDPWLLKKKNICPQCRKKVFHNGQRNKEEMNDQNPLLTHERSSPLNGGTFHAEGTYVAALAAQLAHTSRQRFRFNILNRYRRLRNNWINNYSQRRLFLNLRLSRVSSSSVHQNNPNGSSQRLSESHEHSSDN